MDPPRLGPSIKKHSEGSFEVRDERKFQKVPTNVAPTTLQLLRKNTARQAAIANILSLFFSFCISRLVLIVLRVKPTIIVFVARSLFDGGHRDDCTF